MIFRSPEPYEVVGQLEVVRKALCCYAGPTCDCKYGFGEEGKRRGSEQTGCPEIRSAQEMIKDLATERDELRERVKRLEATIGALA